MSTINVLGPGQQVRRMVLHRQALQSVCQANLAKRPRHMAEYVEKLLRVSLFVMLCKSCGVACCIHTGCKTDRRHEKLPFVRLSQV